MSRRILQQGVRGALLGSGRGVRFEISFPYFPFRPQWSCCRTFTSPPPPPSSEELKTKLRGRKTNKWKPGQTLTNSQILSLYHSYSQKSKMKDVDGMKSILQHPLLYIYGFDRREFIKGCKHALHMISESVSSPRFRAFTYGYILLSPHSLVPYPPL